MTRSLRDVQIWSYLQFAEMLTANILILAIGLDFELPQEDADTHCFSKCAHSLDKIRKSTWPHVCIIIVVLSACLMTTFKISLE